MKKLVLRNQEIEEEDTRMEATAHGDAKVRLTHMRGWDDGIGIYGRLCLLCERKKVLKYVYHPIYLYPYWI